MTRLSQDIIVGTSDPAYTVQSADGTLTIAPTILIESEMDSGIFNGVSNVRLFNFGFIKSGRFIGIQSVGTDFRAVNGEDALISGFSRGVLMGGSGSQTFTNHGTVLGGLLYGVEFGTNATRGVLNNDGYIFGSTFGALMQSSSGVSGTINNAGTIRADSDGLYIAVTANFVTTITNATTGVIKGGNHAIEVSDGRIALTNHGFINGDILAYQPLRDTIVNTGVINGPVHLGDGNDLFEGNGGRSGKVFGEGGADVIAGGARADLIYGGDGIDTLTGRGGVDRFFFDTPLNATTNVDQITDFTPGVDKVVLDASYFAGIGPAGVLAAGRFFQGVKAHDANDRIIYNPNNGFLIHDSNGSANGGATHFATIDPHRVLHNADFVVIA